MKLDHAEKAAVSESSARRIGLAAANGLDRLITMVCRFVVLVTGIALTVIMTSAVAARYVLASGGIDAAQELPERLFPFGNVIVILSYLVLFQQALEVAEIAKLELSPVLGLPGSHGYWAIALGCLLLALATLCSSVRIALTGWESRFSIEYKEI